MARRWMCSNCGSGINAPERMAKLDPRRYCLACSSQPGVTRLIERTCAFLEKRRGRSVAKRSTKASKAKAKREALPYAQRHDLIKRDFNKLLRLPEWRAKWGSRYATSRFGPWLAVIQNRTADYVTGYCGVPGGRIVITIGKTTSRAQVVRLLVHELVHAYCPIWEWHGDRFKSVYQEMKQQACEAGILEERGEI